MSRYFVPVVFLAATAWLAWHNQQGESVLVMPFVDLLFPASAGNAELMGVRSTQMLAAITGALFVWTFIEHARDLRRPDV